MSTLCPDILSAIFAYLDPVTQLQFGYASKIAAEILRKRLLLVPPRGDALYGLARASYDDDHAGLSSVGYFEIKWVEKTTMRYSYLWNKLFRNDIRAIKYVVARRKPELRIELVNVFESLAARDDPLLTDFLRLPWYYLVKLMSNLQGRTMYSVCLYVITTRIVAEYRLMRIGSLDALTAHGQYGCIRFQRHPRWQLYVVDGAPIPGDLWMRIRTMVDR